MSAYAAPWPLRLRAVTVAIALLHLAGVALLLVAGRPQLLGVALMAYLLGLRHGVDADHITAIDSATRRLLATERRPVGVGFLFSIGHGAVVLVAVVGLALAGGTELVDGNGLARAGALGGGTLLLLLGALNVPVLRASMRAETRTRRTLFGRWSTRFTHPLGLLCVGVLFGFGLDSAAAVLLLVGSGVPLPALVGLPLLFGAGMALVDTADGELMRGVYSWALTDPQRRLRANVVVTGASVLLAFGIGAYEVLRGLS